MSEPVKSEKRAPEPASTLVMGKCLFYEHPLKLESGKKITSCVGILDLATWVITASLEGDEHLIPHARCDTFVKSRKKN